MMTDLSSYYGYRFQPEIISYSVWRWRVETAVLKREEACSDHRGHRIRLSDRVQETGQPHTGRAYQMRVATVETACRPGPTLESAG